MLIMHQAVIKRTLDIALASAGLVVLSPVMAVIAALVSLDSPGGVLYRGIRTGKGGRPFAILKFRTMIADAERAGGGSTAKDDPRITRIGHILRKYKLDELPQLWNVVRGEMSIVGPRPELPQYTRLYQGDECIILSVRPGITDYASLQLFQLSEILGSHDADRVYEEQVRPAKNLLRIQYVREQSLLNDARILARTLKRVFWLP